MGEHKGKLGGLTGTRSKPRLATAAGTRKGADNAASTHTRDSLGAGTFYPGTEIHDPWLDISNP